MLHCSAKSALMDVQEKMDDRSTEQHVGMTDEGVQMKVSIVDGVAEVQVLEKPGWTKTCSHLADHFIAVIFSKYLDTDELHLVIDRLVYSVFHEINALILK